MTAALNLHATALVIGTRGFLFVGPSGCGKSSLALSCMAEALAQGIHAALVGDDQVLISARNGAIVAEAIDTIAGQAEIRGADIVAVPCLAAAVMDFAIRPVQYNAAERLAPENEMYPIEGFGALPLLRLPLGQSSILDKLLRLADRRGQNA